MHFSSKIIQFQTSYEPNLNFYLNKTKILTYTTYLKARFGKLFSMHLVLYL